ncbi:hypothetical protein HBI16_174780 [Parastagonospora nodorum]|nr:hypothetical protein HBI16_174780 [Parastagonospora nodorum]
MANPDLDTNQWYQIYLGEDKNGQSLVGTSLYTGSGTKGAVFLSPSNTTAPVQNWQIFPVIVNDTTAYTLRSKESGPNGFLGAQYTPEEATEGKTRPAMFRGDVANNNVYWSFGSWGDGTWFLTCAANGSDYRMNKKNNGIMAMSPNLTAPQNGQRYSFASITKIDDVKYSSVNLVGAVSTSNAISVTSSASPVPTSVSSAAASSSAASSSADAKSENASSGLSTGAKVGIGAALGGAALIALIFLSLFFWKKRRQQPQYTEPQELAYAPATKYQMYQDSALKHELPSPDIVEVPSDERPVELPGQMPQRTGQHP